MTAPRLLRSTYSAIVVLSLAVVLMFLGSGSALAAGSPDIALDKDAPATVLFGTDSAVSLHASNPLGQPYGYNLTFRDVLPAGISYVSGSAPFAPTVIADAPGPGQTTLIWENVGDLSPGSDYSFAYKVHHSTTAHAVGDTYTNQAAAFIQTNPRLVPKFNPDGTPIPASSTGNTAASASTRITAVKIDKSEPSPEGELLRGVHDHQTTYTLKVTNNNVNPTDTVFVDDYLPAGLEFLQCGGIDHTTDAPTNPGSAEEYPGSGSLIPGTVLPPPECPAPDVVETVNVSPDGVLPAAIYTHVRWSLADLAPGAVETIRYRAAIPIRENTLDWNGTGLGNGIAPPSTCTAGVCEQAANLDNNSGPETFDEQELTNVAQVSGLYRGIEQASDQTTLTRTAEDLAVQKRVTPSSIAEGDLSTWTLDLQTGEYRTLQDIHVADTLPNGLCPLGASLLGGPGDFNHEGFPQSPECDNVTDAQPSDPYTSVAEQSDGTYAITWDSASALGLAQMDPSTTLQITFPTRTRSHYQSNFLDAAPILNYDSWTNHVTINGPNFVIEDSNGDLIDHDGPSSGPTTDVSAASQTAGGPSIDKQVASPTGLDPVSCAGVYLNTIASSYGPGDIVCWQLTVNFAAGVHAKDSVVSDFLPTGSEYVAGSQAVTGSSTAPVISFDGSSTDTVAWQLGDFNGYVEPGAVFQVRFASRITGPEDDSGDIKGNLMKFSDANTAGKTFPLRDAANFEITKPVLALTKGVLAVEGVNVPGGPRDGVSVNGGDVVTYRIDVTNSGDRDAASANVWDQIPIQATCTDISNISDGGVCAAGIIKWTGIGPIAPGPATSLTYDMTVPTSLAPGERLDNTAAVTKYTSATNDAGNPEFDYWPANPTLTDPAAPAVPNAPAAQDPSDVEVPGSFVKSRLTSITGQPGNDVAQATIGEQVRYSIALTIPRHTTVSGSATVVDPVPAGLTYVPGSAAANLDGTALPTAGLVLSFDPSGNGTVKVQAPPVYTNNTNADQILTISFAAMVADSYPQNARPGTITNTATLTFNDSQGIPQTRTAGVDTAIVEPNLHLAKDENDGNDIVDPGQTVRYTLTVTNPSSPPAQVSSSYDTQLVDTLPVGLIPLQSTSPNVPATDGGTVGPDGGTWNAAARTITWAIGSVAPGAAPIRRYDVEVDGQRVAGSALPNSATVTGTSISGTDAGERGPSTSAPGYKATANDSVTLLGVPVIGKTVSPTVQTPGGNVTYTLDVVIPGGLRFWDLTVLDQLPDGLRYTGFVDATCSSGCPPAADVSGQVAAIPPTQNPVTGDTPLGFSLGDIAPAAVGADRTIRIRYTAHMDDQYVGPVSNVTAGDTLTNGAGVFWNLTDKVTGLPGSVPPASSFDVTGPTASADVRVVEPKLTLDKNVSGDPGNTDAREAQPGEGLTYTITVSNTGTDGSTAYDVLVTDQPDAELTNVQLAPGVSTSTNTDGWTAASPGMAWLIPSIGPNSSVTLTYTADVRPGSQLHDGDVASNTAGVTEYFNFPGPVRPPDSKRYTDVTPDTVDVTIDLPSLSLVKTTGEPGFPDSASGLVGEPFHWRVVVTNTASVAQAVGVDVADTLPAGWEYVAGSAQLGGSPLADPAITGGTALAWTDITDLAAGASATVTFDATPTTAALDSSQQPTNPYTNSAQATASDSSGSTTSLNGPYQSNTDTAQANLTVPTLTIAKTPDAGSATAGQPFNWTIEVTNSGAAVASNVVIRDVLPAGVTYTPNDATFAYAPAAPAPTLTRLDEATSATDREISWKLSSLAVGQKVTVTVPVTPDADLANATHLVNTAYAKADQQPIEVDDPGDVTVTRTAAIAIVKTAHASPVTAGTNAVFDLVVQNNGPSDADNVVVTDVLPAGLIASTATVTPGAPACAIAAATVTCNLGTMTPTDAPRTITISAQVDPSRTADITNAATATADDSPPATDDATVTIDQNANVKVDKAVSPGTILQGHQAAYTIGVHNEGPSDATAVTLDDVIPDGLSIVSIAPGAPTCTTTGQAISCAFGTLPPGAAGDRTVTVVVRGDAPGTTTNTATVATTTPGDTPGDDTATADLVVKPVADIDVVKSAPATVAAGGTLTYTLHVTNKGPATATGVTLSDPMPAGVEAVAVRGPEGACTATPALVTCDLGTLAKDESRDVEVDARATFAVAGQTVMNTATVTLNETDEQPADNQSTAPTTVGPAADLAIDKSGPATAAPGASLVYVLAVTNKGPQTATGVTVTDTLPAGTSFVAAVPSQGTPCTAAGQTLTCPLGTMPAGGSAQIAVTVKVATATRGVITNAASVTGAEPDGDLTNNADQAPTTIGGPGAAAQGDTSLLKRLDKGQTIEPGKPVSYTMVVRNDASTPATNVVVVDTPSLPVTVTSAKSTRGTCTTTVPIRCELGTLPPHAIVTIRITMIPLVAGELTNQATVIADGGDKRPEDNTSAVNGTGVVAQRTILTVRKTSDTATTRPGGSVWFTLRVKNTGSHTATDVRVCDVPPAGTSIVSLRGGKLVGRRACFSLPILKTGDSASYRVKIRVAAGTTSRRLRNVVSATASNARTVRSSRTVLSRAPRSAGPRFTG